MARWYCSRFRCRFPSQTADIVSDDLDPSSGQLIEGELDVARADFGAGDGAEPGVVD